MQCKFRTTKDFARRLPQVRPAKRERELWKINNVLPVVFPIRAIAPG
jgi:hypothetical protein